MNNLQLSLGVLILSILIGFASGPLDKLKDMPDGALADGAYWRDVAEDSIRSGAAQMEGVLTVVASALGITIYRRARGGNVGDGGNPPAGSSPPGF